MKSLPRNFSSVFALAGDSTMTIDLAHREGGGNSHNDGRKAQTARRLASLSNTLAIPEESSVSVAVSVKHSDTRLPARLLTQRLGTRSVPPSTRRPRAPPPSSSKRPASTVAAGRSSGLRELLGRERLLARQRLEEAPRLRRELPPAARTAARARPAAAAVRPPGRAPRGRPPRRGRGSRRRAGARACRRRSRRRRARHGEHVAAEVGREPRGDERARAPRGLDDDDSGGEPRDDAVADREVLGPRLGRPADTPRGADAAPPIRSFSRACSRG